MTIELTTIILGLCLAACIGYIWWMHSNNGVMSIYPKNKKIVCDDDLPSYLKSNYSADGLTIDE